MNAARAVLVVLAGAVAPLSAQQASPNRDVGLLRATARYSKWAAVAGAVALTALAMGEHRHSDDAWNSLLDICRSDNQDCALGASGAYINPVAEAYYQRALYYDARARQRLMFGQIAFALGAALFIYDLSGGSEGPPNIPFDPNRLVLGPSAVGGTQVGWRLEF